MSNLQASRLRNFQQKRTALQKNIEDSKKTRLKAWKKRMAKLGYTTDATNTAFKNGKEVGTFEGGLKKPSINKTNLKVNKKETPKNKEKKVVVNKEKKVVVNKEKKKVDVKKETPKKVIKSTTKGGPVKSGVEYARSKGDDLAGFRRGPGTKLGKDTRITKKLKKSGFTEDRLARLRKQHAEFKARRKKK